MKKAEILLDEKGIEALGGDATAIRELYDDAVKARAKGDRDEQAERDLAKSLKAFGERTEKLKVSG